MFDEKNRVLENHQDRKTLLSRWPLALAQLALVTLLASGPAWATDPIDVDPDPDGAPSSMTVLYVDESESIDVGSLAPGHYQVVVLGENGPEEIYELEVQ